ncbi:hypothetical protein C8R46DRAFT_1221736 [Mycena filopes]|nr:hypothetical protein C8R46DRAFT_1221736 [Mycena filopes]
MAVASLIPDILSFESQAKLLIQASEANIARIESQIRDLERLRDRERGILTRLRSAIAPVHKLPAELLVEVFRYTCDDPTFDHPSTIKKVQALTHVCAYWRRVAITTPQLWTHFPPIQLAKTPRDAFLAGLKEWLKRSAALPIDIYLAWRNAAVDSAAVMSAVITAAPRWSSAYFNIPSLSVLSDFPPDRLEQLRKLTVQSSDPSSAVTAAFSLAPILDEVSLTMVHIGQLRLPWSQLAHLSVVTNFSQECLDTLLQCLNLVYLKVSIPAWPELPDLSEIRPTILGRLETLDIKFQHYTPGFVTPLFVYLALPRLKHFSIYLDSAPWPATEFARFQARASNMEHMNFYCRNLDSHELMAILRRAPTLLTLELWGCTNAFDETIVTALSSSHQTLTQLVPRLHSLSVAEGCYDFEEDMLDALIAARWWTDAQLAGFPSPPRVSRWSTIYVDRDGNHDLSPEFAAKVDEYGRQGLNVEIM